MLRLTVGYPNEMDQRPLQETVSVWERKLKFPRGEFRCMCSSIPWMRWLLQWHLNSPFDTTFWPRGSLSTGQKADSSKLARSSGAEQSCNRWTEGEVKLLITIYGEEWQNRDSKRRLEPMWERTAEKLVAECRNMDIACDKLAKK